MQEHAKENADIIKKYAKERRDIIKRVFDGSDSIFAQLAIIHDIFMFGYADGFAQAFTESFNKGFNQESIESIEPEALEQRKAERRLQVLRYLLPRCAGLRFPEPEVVSAALEQAQRLDSPEQLQTLLYSVMMVSSDEEARTALAVKETPEYTDPFRDTIKEGSKEGKKGGLGEAFLQIVETRFPTLLAQAKQVIEQQTSVEQLQMLFDKFCQTNTIEEAQAIFITNE